MAKGKYRSRKDNRDAAQLTEDLRRVRVQLSHEQQRLTEMSKRADLDTRLRAELADAIALRDSVCAPQLTRIAEDREVIRAAARELADASREIGRHSHKVGDWACATVGLEYYYALLSGNRARLTEGVVTKRQKNDAAEAIQRSRGLRTRPPLNFTAEQKMALALACAKATGTDLPAEVTEIDGPAWDAYADYVTADSAATIALQSPPPWLDIAADNAHQVSRILGANPAAAAIGVDAPQTVPGVAELATGTAAQRDTAAAAGATAVAEAFIEVLQNNVGLACQSQISAMVAAGSPYPAPPDAASMHAWYAASAIGAWGRHRTTVNGRVAVAATAAVPFWLPPGHTIAYLDSEPLTGQDVDDMRLPFAQVLVTFSEPPRLLALDPGLLPDDDPRLRWMDHLLAANKGLPDPKEMMIGGSNSFQSLIPTLWDAIAARGAHIEAILLLGDAHGRLDDLFAWCVAIPASTAGKVLGRWVIPASRQQTSYPDLVLNAAAVAAWADWHRPGRTRDVGEQGTDQAAAAAWHKRRLEDSVHVLNVTATTSADPDLSRTGEPTGRTTSPHRRRGHWRRRQRYGPGRTLTRRVRIAPVMVNAGRPGDDRPQIYRLPTPVSRESDC